MKSKRPNASQEAATKADIADEERGEEPTMGVVMTAPIPQKSPSKAAKRPASKKSTAARRRTPAKKS